MCGRYTLDGPEDKKALVARFHIQGEIPHLTSNFNVAPTQRMPVVISQSPNQIQLMEWGILPPWDRHARPIINARSETVFEKATFRKLIETQRCLVPATGFYEWQVTSHGKVPHFIHLTDKKIFSFAGFYKVSTNDRGVEDKSYVILTTQPNDLMKPIHNRMPVILDEEGEHKWLNSDNVEKEQLEPLLKPYNPKHMEAYPVSTQVNNIHNNNHHLTDVVK